MGPTLSGFLAAGFLLGQTSGGTTTIQYISPPPAGSAYSNSVGGTQSVIVQQDGSVGTTPRRTILSRVQGWFGRGDAPSGPMPQTYQMQPNGSYSLQQPQPTQIMPSPAPTNIMPAPTPGEFPRRMPSSSLSPLRIGSNEPIVETAGAMPVASGSVIPVKMQPAQTSPLRPALANKVGRDEKFTWITGQLEIENGAPVLYYATPETVDQFHGRLVLQTRADLSKFRRGDLVTAEGQLVQRRGASAVYQATNINVVEQLNR